jgi:hypothetical protein
MRVKTHLRMEMVPRLLSGMPGAMGYIKTPYFFDFLIIRFVLELIGY